MSATRKIAGLVVIGCLELAGAGAMLLALPTGQGKRGPGPVKPRPSNRLDLGWPLATGALYLLTMLNSGLVVYLLRQASAVRVDQRRIGEGHAVEMLSIREGLAALEKRLGEEDAAARASERRLVELGCQLDRLAEAVRRPSEDPRQAQETRQARDETVIAALRLEIEGIRSAVVGLEHWSGQATPITSALALEREILGEAWKKFRDNGDLILPIENASRNAPWQAIKDTLLFRLPSTVPEDLKPTCDTVLAPARDFHNLVSRFVLIPRLVSDGMPSSGSEIKDLMRLREYASLLTLSQTSNLVADRLNFRLERWVGDQFLGFADLFLQRVQQAQLEGNAAQLDPGHQIVKKVLKVVDLEPIDIVLGQTTFDSTRHIGRSTASDPHLANGTIIGVVRNGFIKGGHQVIRQPEVIVNRVG